MKCAILFILRNYFYKYILYIEIFARKFNYFANCAILILVDALAWSFLFSIDIHVSKNLAPLQGLNGP